MCVKFIAREEPKPIIFAHTSRSLSKADVSIENIRSSTTTKIEFQKINDQNIKN